MNRLLALAAVLSVAAGFQHAKAQDVTIPVLVPLTGFLSLEGTSQRNGAALALAAPPAGVKARAEVVDVGVAPEAAVNALEKAAGQKPLAVVASMLGAQVLAMLPVAQEQKLPLLTISGTAQVTSGNPYVFRFFLSDDVIKIPVVRYLTADLAKRRPAIIYQTTSYGQGGHASLVANLARRGITPAYEEGIDVAAKDLLPSITKAMAANPDVLIIHLHAGPTALFVKQAAQARITVPIMAGSAMSQPATAALVEPRDLKGVCTESTALPALGVSPAMDDFVNRYRKAYGGDPDAYALAQYDGTMMALAAVKAGAKTAEEMRAALSRMSYEGAAMTYKSDGKGNMAHSAAILCYDGTSRTPKLAKRFDAIDSPP